MPILVFFNQGGMFMFLIKQICVNNMERRVYVEDGLTVSKIGKGVWSASEFWGTTLLNSGAFPKQDHVETTILSCQSYLARPIGDGRIELCLFDGDKSQFSKTNIDDEQFVDYLIFVRKSLEDIKTNAEVLFMRYPTEIVCAMKKNGDYIEVDGFRFEYEDKRVSYKTYI